jgi:hypothetical protein
MRTLTNIKSSIKLLFAAVTVSAMLVSCSKDFDDTPAPAVSALNIINAVPSAESLDFFVDNTKANSEEFSFTKRLGYYNLYAGDRQLSINKKGTSTPVLTEKFTMQPERFYSLFVIDRFESPKFLLVKDSVSLPATGKANLRFINLSPDAPVLNLAIAGAATDLVTDKAYKQYSEFMAVDASPKVTFNVKNKETGAIEASLADVKIESGRTYTIWVKGLKSSTDNNKLGLTIFTH